MHPPSSWCSGKRGTSAVPISTTISSKNHQVPFPPLFPPWIGFLGNIEPGNHRFSHEIYGFPVNFPLNQSIENNKKLWIPLIPKTIPKTEEPPGAVCGTPGAVDSALTSFATLVMYGSGILLGSPVAWRSRIGPGGQAWKIAVLNEEK
jgi:hypothetical protein